jgi:hypothetical protein
MELIVGLTATPPQNVEQVQTQGDRLRDCVVRDCAPLHPASRFRQRRMNPDKLFDYLDGRLSAAERAALEERLISDQQLQRALAVARQIHLGMQGDSREVLLPTEVDVSARGRKMALRVGAAFIVLMAVNVGIGLWLIARHETKNPNRTLLERQMRQQITKALEHAATTLTPALRKEGLHCTNRRGTGRATLRDSKRKLCDDRGHVCFGGGKFKISAPPSQQNPE